MKILEEYHCLCQCYYKVWIFYLNDCVLNSGTLQSWKSSSKNLINQEHCILVILFLKSTFCIPSFS